MLLCVFGGLWWFFVVAGCDVTPAAGARERCAVRCQNFKVVEPFGSFLVTDIVYVPM